MIIVHISTASCFIVGHSFRHSFCHKRLREPVFISRGTEPVDHFRQFGASTTQINKTNSEDEMFALQITYRSIYSKRDVYFFNDFKVENWINLTLFLWDAIAQVEDRRT